MKEALSVGETACLALSDRIAATARALRAAARDAAMPLTGDDRVGEADAATLIGLSPSRLRALRSEQDGPRWFRRAAAGSRVSYRLLDLAEWIERGRDDAC